MKNKPKCEWCGAEKTVITGLCPKCCRFPSAKSFRRGIK